MVPRLIVIIGCMALISGCAKSYYAAMEKVGIHKRDIMVDRVEAARDAQADAQEQFRSALERFDSVIRLRETDLKKSYDRLQREFEASEQAAEKVSSRIRKVESVARDLFAEWEDELELYRNRDLQRASREKLEQTRSRYRDMLASMHRAEASMQPVLAAFRDNVLFLKHNLNAQAIGSLKAEFTNLKTEIGVLIDRMNQAIESSDRFIAHIR